MFKRVIPARMKAARTRCALSQRQLAKRAGLGLSTIIALEGGQGRDIHLSTILKLCLALSCTPNHLTGHDEVSCGYVCSLCKVRVKLGQRHGLATCVRASRAAGGSIDLLMERYYDLDIVALMAILDALAEA